MIQQTQADARERKAATDFLIQGLDQGFGFSGVVPELVGESRISAWAKPPLHRTKSEKTLKMRHISSLKLAIELLDGQATVV